MPTTARAAPVRPLDFETFRQLENAELEARIRVARAELGDSLLILGHHYQQDEVIQFADLTGDSYRLSALAAQNEHCKSIVFCGVHFMAETADILANRGRGPKGKSADDRVAVILPDLSAGCSMADMADIDQVE